MEQFVKIMAEEFATAVMARYGLQSPRDALSINGLIDRTPVTIERFDALQPDEVQKIKDQFDSPAGCALFRVELPADWSVHPLLSVAGQLIPSVKLRHPIAHPIEKHPRQLQAIGRDDGTVKIYEEVENRGIALSNRAMAAHQDGLGSGGAVTHFALMLESAAEVAARTFAANVLLAALPMYTSDLPAFRSLFLPDAITVRRTAGARALSVTGPILYLNSSGRPQCFMRIPDGEYLVLLKNGNKDLARAFAYLCEVCTPDSTIAVSFRLMRPGDACLVDNAACIHGRTDFLNGEGRARRVVARKWWAASVELSEFGHYPGMHLDERYYSAFPLLFPPDQRSGEWRYDSNLEKNVRLS